MLMGAVYGYFTDYCRRLFKVSSYHQARHRTSHLAVALSLFVAKEARSDNGSNTLFGAKTRGEYRNVRGLAA